ncbi:arf-GAP domain and FG repeat-containing protein 1-like isoform X4 [Ruditapes philippinarum]|uniref:arf-GAP domain and FG repeat-containing protein 1-like isoform X3 n=1 Tax=Ruditapes philippinarum TaxID=129788 RepID=UPI00295BC0A3|nr:arf-GAP domain and FG repeat-containing protein 1-like isoform X3 [Ruditapes philippinarum]XP_060573780.1 arf-GAP domain and FG repeat-containing protein 1-like isoform X4 [Ruditapes philippinarum]
MASNKKKLDEKHLKMLREMVALPHNKQCFDCHQRGPTYVNMTIGSYVCTACSGLLRGLNPPHRVKSISMASFTADEMEFIKCHGNEYCRKVWLGLYDNRLSGQTEGRDEAKVKDFMAQKYERKRYYVAPSDSMKDEAKRMNESAITTKTPGTKPLKSLLGENAPKLHVGNTQNGNISHYCKIHKIIWQKAPVSATPPPIGSTPQSPGNLSIQSSKSTGSTAMDLLGDLGGDPFASSAPQTHPPGGGGFADFGNFGNTASSTQQTPSFPQSAPLQPSGSSSQASQQSVNGFTSTPASSVPAGGAGGDKYSNLSDLFSVPTTSEESPSTGWSSMSTSNAGVSWGGTTNSTGGINWGGESNTASSGGGLWNSSSTQSIPSSSSLNWGGSTGSTVPSSMSWGGAPATAQSNGLGVPGNPFLTATVANPFGGGSNTSLTSQSSMGVQQAPNANPFGGQAVASTGGFGAFGAQNTAVSQSAGFGQFGTPASTAGAGFGQFGTPASSAGAGFGQFGTPASTAGAGFGQFGGIQQNGGFGANTTAGGFGGAQTNTQQGFPPGQAGFGGQPQQQGFGAMPGAGFGGQPQQQAGFGGQPQHQAGFGGQPAQMQGFGGAPVGGGWGQMPASSATVNPFMSTAQQYSGAPKTGATNPFL